MSNEVIFKIRDKTTGLFSTGGEHPSWHKVGKVWRTKGALSNHINLIARPLYDCYAGAEIVEYTTIIQETNIIPLQDKIQTVLNKKAKEHALYQAKYDAWEIERLEKKLVELKERGI